MSPLLSHLLIGIGLVAVGTWLLRRGRLALVGWILCASGAAFALMGVVVPAVHGYLFH